MLTNDELTDLEIFLNDGCLVSNPVDFASKHDLESMARALDRLMPACATLLVMLRAARAERDE